MKSPLKNKVKKFSMKMLSVLVVIFLLSSVASTAVSKMEFSKLEEEIEKKTEQINKIKDKFQGFSQKLRDIIDQIRDMIQTLRGVKNEDGDKVTAHKLLRAMEEGSSSLKFYTKYNGHVEETTLRLFSKTKIDIDGNDENDFSVDYRLGLGVVRPLSISINFKFIFEKLPGYDKLADKKGEFEAYTQIYFAGILFKELANKRLRVGFYSDAGEKIPEDLTMIYKLVPHILQFDKKMDHRFVLNPGEDVEGKHDLSLMTSFTEFNNSVIVKDVTSRVDYSPIVNSEISIKGFRKFGESHTEYEQIRADGSKVDLYVKSTKGDVTMTAYAAGLPDHVLFMKKLAKNGYIRFNTFGQSVKEIGLLDNYNAPEKANKAFFTGIFSEANLTWNINLFKKGIANVSVYTVGNGVSANLHLEGPEDGTADFKATPTANLLDCDMELNLKDGYFVINKNDFEVEVEFSVYVENESIQEYLSSLEGSFIVKKWTDGQFKILFDDILCGNVTVNLAGKSLELTDVNIMGYSKFLGGEFYVRMDRFHKFLMGDVKAHLDTKQKEGNITGNCSLDIVNGVNITNLSLKFGEFEFARDNINTKHDETHWYNFTIAVNIVQWYVASDFSSGYIVIKGASYVYFSFDSTYTNYSSGELLGKVKGIIELKTLSEEFNISWNTIDGNFTFNIDGSGVAQLSEFELYLKDKVDISIEKIKGSFKINTYNKTGSLLLEIDDGVFGVTLDSIKLDITGFPIIKLKGKISFSISAGAEGHFLFLWNESGGWLAESDFSLEATGVIDITDFEFSFKESIADISFDRLMISGDLTASFIKNETGLFVIASGQITEINVSGIQAYFTHTMLAVHLTDISFYGAGEFSFSYDEEVLLVNTDIHAEDSEIVINVLWLDLIDLALIFNGVYISGPLDLVIDVNSSNPNILGVILDPEEDLYVEHINLGPEYVEIWDLKGGGEDSYFGLNFALDHPAGLMGMVMPVLHFVGEWEIEELSAMEDIVIPELLINGSISIEFWYDLLSLSFLYLNGVAYETSNVVLRSKGIKLGFEPGKFNIMLQQNILSKMGQLFNPGQSAYFYVVIDTINWVTIGALDKEYIRVQGFLELRLDIQNDEDGKINILVDSKDVDGLLIILDAVRIVGDIKDFIFEASFYFSNEDGVISFSNLDVYTTGSFNASMSIKLSNDSGWISCKPFPPYLDPVTDGAVSLLLNEKITKPKVSYVPNNNVNFHFQAWFSPPVNVKGESRNFTYTLDYGDGSEDVVIITNDTEVRFPNHDYSVGEYEAKVTVSVEGSSNDVTDYFGIIVKNGSYCGHKDIYPNYISEIYGKMVFTYEELGDDGNFHFSFIASNNADEDHPYTLHWEAEKTFGRDWKGDEWTFEPSNGILEVGEEQLINVTAPPPYDHGDHVYWPATAWYGLNNTNYEHSPDKYDSSGTECRVFDGYVWVHPENRLRYIDLTPGKPRFSSFLIKNAGNVFLNYSIDTSDLSPNGTWEFSKLSGTVAPYGADPVSIKVNASDYGLNLDSMITIINDDNTSDIDTLVIKAKSKQNGSQLPEGMEVSTKGNETIIRIGGFNKIEIDDLYFNINGIAAYLNGNFSLEVGENNWVCIVINSSSEIPLSINGSCEFLIDEFIFRFGDNVRIDVSYLTGEFEFRKGRSGNVSIGINESSTDVNIEIDIDYGSTEVTLQGEFDVIISGEAYGKLWFDWDLTGVKPIVDFGGDLYREGTFSIGVVDLLFNITSVNITADEILFVGSGGDMTVNGEEICFSSEINTAIIENLAIYIDSEKFPLINKALELDGTFGLDGDAEITISLIKIEEKETFELEIGFETEEPATATISDLSIYVHNSNEEIFANLSSFQLTVSQSRSLIIDNRNISLIGEGATTLNVTKFIFDYNDGEIFLNMSLNLAINSQTDLFRINIDNMSNPKEEFRIDLEGLGASVTLQNTMIAADILDLSLSLECEYLDISATAGGTFLVNETAVYLNGLGSVDLSITNLFLEIEAALGLFGVYGDVSLNIPSIDVHLSAGVDELKIIKEPESPKVTRVLPSNSSIYIGDKLQLVAFTDPPGYQDQIEWISLNPLIATVDSTTGEVTGKMVGKAKINASLGGKNVSITVNVIGISSSFHIIPEMVTLDVGDQFKLTTNAEADVTWESLNEDIASVNETSGVITVNGIGTATIRAYDGSNYDTSTIISPKKETQEYDIVLKGDIVVSGYGEVTLNIVESLTNLTFELDLTNIVLSIDNLYFSLNKTTTILGDGWCGTTTKQQVELSWSTLDASDGYLYVVIPNSFDGFETYASIDSCVITQLSAKIKEKSIECDLFSLSLNVIFKVSLSSPQHTNNFRGIYSEFDGDLTIENIVSNTVLNILNNVHIDANGDILWEKWEDVQGDTNHNFESENGITIDEISLELDNGIFFGIERYGALEGYISSGYIDATYDLNGDGDGFFMLDSSYITFEDVRITYFRSKDLDWGIRFYSPSEGFNADGWLIQWDAIYLPGTFIPYNWKIQGSINGDIDIDVTDGNNWYNLWP